MHYGDLSLFVLVVLFGVFFVAGFIDSIAGGGGLLSIPALLLAGIPPQYALGTNKFIVVFGTASALVNFIKHKKIIYKITLLSVVFSLLGAHIGTELILSLSESIATKVILFLLPLSALSIFIPHNFVKNNPKSFNSIQTFLYAPLLSLLIGVYDGFFGAGTGTFLILGFYLFLQMDMLSASASAKAINLASGLGSLVTFAFSNHIFYFLALPLIVANILGGYTGSKLAIKKGVGLIRIFIIISFVLVFISLLLKYLKSYS
ncbi:sulfite exporter TauE/SafE family protein [Helicobacter cappadocius]|uniref:Probable membrane transporter protein n=1 Tax=Helicobacter cappadocius TaxID=3063998 RepID=A0AA90Q3G5_9HELI|nr:MULTISPECIES: TSUP family transporter [unclassified Helicobacter]MDO7253531.1 TSUP family transporter [Helicobacter sp. faydin-H75]MDP2539458.1 TSUP family transporter [Helicobacter sp. faydin-H76]